MPATRSLGPAPSSQSVTVMFFSMGTSAAGSLSGLSSRLGSAGPSDLPSQIQPTRRLPSFTRRPVLVQRLDEGVVAVAVLVRRQVMDADHLPVGLAGLGLQCLDAGAIRFGVVERRLRLAVA